VAKYGKTNINNSVLSREGNRQYLVDQTREIAVLAE